MTILYASLAGLGIATKRALIMTSMYLLAVIFYKISTAIEIYCLALIAVLIMDPFVSLSSSFWLSFGAVGFLLYTNHKKNLKIAKTRLKGINYIISLIKINWVMLIGLLPLSGLFFNKISLISGVANLVAVPWVNFLVLPWILIGLFWYSLCGVDLAITSIVFANFNLQLLINVLDRLQGISYATISVTKPSLVDAGPNNKVVTNYFKYFNTKNLDYVIISHLDLDHSGGLGELIKVTNVNNLITNEQGYKIVNLTSNLCQSNYKWSIDGVNFEFLHPRYSDSNYVFTKKNDNSCVLKMTTPTYSMLFTGDISSKAEKMLIKKYSSYLKSDILLIPHHGSKSSSSLEFIKEVSPKYAVVSAGYMNRYGHPKNDVLDRYLSKNIKILNTVEHGTIDFMLNSETIEYNCYRIATWNFWNY